MSRASHVLLVVAFAAALPAVALSSARQAIPISVFDDAQSWPELAPGSLGQTLQRLPDMRITMDAMFGPGAAPSRMYVDVTGVKFQRAPAVWIHYLSTGVDDSPTNGTVALDAIVVDRSTARALFRLQSAVPPSAERQRWGGAYDVVQFGPEALVRTRVGEDGSADVHRLDVPPVAEFATLGFVLPGLDLAPGKRFRIPGYTPGLDRVVSMPMRVEGRVPFVDAAGATHEVWAVDLLTQNRAIVIRFFVSDDAPHFYGWAYRRVADGVPVMTFTLRSWQRLE